jgi:hypothetical protein
MFFSQSIGIQAHFDQRCVAEIFHEDIRRGEQSVQRINAGG